MKKIIISISTTMIISLNLLSSAITYATEKTQDAQLIAQVGQYVLDNKFYEAQLIKEAAQLEALLKNLDPFKNGGMPIPDLTTDLQKIANSMNAAAALSYAMGNVDQNFRQNHLGYDTYFAVASDETLSDGQKAQSFTQKYKDISKETQNTVKATLNNMNINFDDLQDQDKTIQKLKALSQSADGNLKVAQAANDIALFQLQQLKKLQSTMMNQTNLQAEYYAGEIEKESIEESKNEHRRTGGMDVNIGNEHQVTKW